MPDDFLRSIWSSRLPPNLQAILSGQHKASLDAAAWCADRISEVAPHPALAGVGPPSDNTAFLQVIEDFSLQVATLTAEQDRLRNSFRDPHVRSRDPCSSTRDHCLGSRNRRLGSRSPSRDDAASTLCWYHRRFGARTQKCTLPCAYRQQGK
jgi:hypothetical protein